MKKFRLVISVALISVMGLVGCASVASQDATAQVKAGERTQVATEDAGKTVTTHDGKTVDVSGVTLRIAAASGLNGHVVVEAAGLDDTPYNVEFTIMQGGNLVMEALAANQIDLGAGSQIPPLSASLANNGGNFKVIAVRYGSTLNQELIVGPGSEIQTVADLKGKKVGYVKNTTANYFLSKMLTEAGLEWSDVDAQPLTTSDGLTAVLTGEVEAFASYGNSITSAKEKGATTLESAQDILSGNYLFYATPAAIENEAYHAAIEDWLERWHEAHEWARQNPEEWAAYYAPTINMEVADYLKQFEEENTDKIYACKPITDAVIADEQDIADTFEGLGLLEQHVNTEEFFDLSFVDAVSAFTQYD
ncbi:MAG: ABC transporter substrate-binding protein [Lachnospiraceae bacterium]|nr:ABC transporter substrate-binding protein [Lachnospiraceae bacterium]